MHHEFARRRFLLLCVGTGAAGLAAACSTPTAVAPTSPPTTAAGAAAPSPAASPVASAAAKPSVAGAASPSAAAASPSPAAATGQGPAALARLSPVRATVRGGSIFGLTDSPMILALERGYFQQVGITLDLQQFDTIVNMIPLLSTGQLDVAFDGASSAGFFNALARGISIKMVANQGVADGSHETPYYGLVAAKSLMDSGQVKRISDLRGKPVNLLSVGSLAELNVDDALRTDGLTLNDVQVQQLAFPDSLAALRNGSLAASFMIEPFITLGKQQGVLDVLISSEKVAPGREITEVFYAAQFAQNRDAANNFMAAYLQGVRDYNDVFFRNRGDRTTAVNQLTQRLAVKDAALYDRMGLPAVNPDGRINAADVKSQQDWYVGRGEVQQPIDINQAVDNSFADFALGILGQYS
jgi:NitT/TauT family transport system substrate-binding protein